MIIDVIDCLLCNAGCCNIKHVLHVTLLTSAVLRLECSLVCISGSVGHQQNIFRSFSHCQRFF